MFTFYSALKTFDIMLSGPIALSQMWWMFLKPAGLPVRSVVNTSHTKQHSTGRARILYVQGKWCSDRKQSGGSGQTKVIFCKKGWNCKGDCAEAWVRLSPIAGVRTLAGSDAGALDRGAGGVVERTGGGWEDQGPSGPLLSFIFCLIMRR